MGVGSLSARRRALFLDRDGVIVRAVVRNGKPFPPSSVSEVDILPGVPAALQRAKAMGFLNLVVTNQPDVARGRQLKEKVEEINRVLLAELAIDDVLVCYHDDSDACECRKPRPGLLFQAANTYDLDLRSSIMIGDRWRDIDAGAAAGCQTILIDYGYNERLPASPPDLRVASLAEAVASLSKLEAAV
jgi:D-glycero-D-manno-heptose 1,7-bisphosphate phosphatase